MGLKIKSRTLNLSHDIPVERLKPYWEGLGKGVLMATRCESCDVGFYPPQVDCSQCLSSDNIKWVEAGETGTLVTFTESHLKPQGFEQYAGNYIIAVVETNKGLKVAGWVVDATIGQLQVGDRVGISTAILSDGFPSIRFTPIKPE
jgi:uncharacterized OB-fold protein